MPATLERPRTNGAVTHPVTPAAPPESGGYWAALPFSLTQYERNVQTALVPAGGGGVFDVKIDRPGRYPFVSHSFAAVDLGQVGVLNVGHVAGTMSH